MTKSILQFIVILSIECQIQISQQPHDNQQHITAKSHSISTAWTKQSKPIRFTLHSNFDNYKLGAL